MPTPRIEPVQRACSWCGSVFEVGGRGRAKRATQFCSKSCAAEARVILPRVGKLTPTVAAYAAGILDGEGSIILWRPRASTSQRVRLRLVVVNTNEAVMDWLRGHLGGSTHRRQFSRTNMSDHPLPIWSWQSNGSNATAILRQLLPYLVIKREKAVVAIASQPRHAARP